jgi:hypothetical protein
MNKDNKNDLRTYQKMFRAIYKPAQCTDYGDIETALKMCKTIIELIRQGETDYDLEQLVLKVKIRIKGLFKQNILIMKRQHKVLLAEAVHEYENYTI